MTTSSGDKFAIHARAVAVELYGDANTQLSSRSELRFGRHGSKSVDLEKGQFFNHETNEGGGVLWAIEQETGRTVAGGQAIEWMRERGFDVEERPAPPPQASGGSSRRSDSKGNWLPNRVPDNGELTKAYDYVNQDGDIVYQVCRFEWEVDPSVNPKGREKTFVQRRKDTTKKGGWAYSMQGVTWLPYRLPELIEDIAQGYKIFLVEGEKKVDMLRALGVPATCNHGGAGKFPEDLVPWFKDSDVVLLPDNDEAGRKHMGLVGRRLEGVAKSIRLLNLPGLPHKGGIDDWLPAGGSAAQLFELSGNAGEFEAEPYQSQFDAVTWLDLRKPGPKHEYLVKGVFTKGEQSMLLGESQSGKSFLAIDIAMAVATGRDWFGRKVSRGGVVYQAGESAAGVRRKRLPAYAQLHGIEETPLPFTLLQGKLDLFTSDEPAEAFIEECKHWAGTFDVPLELIVIDTFSKATSGANENDGKDMSLVLDRCDKIRRATQAHVMLVHHLNASGGKARGHTSLFANVENVVTVRRIVDELATTRSSAPTYMRDSDGRLLREWHISKNKDGEDDASVRFVLPASKIGFDEEGDPITSCTVLPAGRGSKTRLANDNSRPDGEGLTMSGTNAAVLRALYDAVARHGQPAPASLRLPDGIAVVDRKQAAKQVRMVLDTDDLAPPVGPTEDPQDAARRRHKAVAEKAIRARDHLFAKGVIAMTADWLWLTGKDVRGFGRVPQAGSAQDELPIEAASQTVSQAPGPSVSPQASAEDEDALRIFEGGM
jgi:hypothetical protein